MLSRTQVDLYVSEHTGPAVDGAAGWYARHATMIGAAVLSLYILACAVMAFSRPDANWDILPYIAVAEESNFQTPQEVHAFTYATVKDGLSAHEYRMLSDDGGGYRSHMAANADDFASMLPMYRVKFFYAEMISTLSNVMPPIRALHTISAFSILLIGAVTLLWLRWANALALGPVIAGVLMMTEFSAMGRAGTPDLLCAGLMLAGLYAFMRQREIPAAILLFLAFLVRPDSVIPLAVLAVMVMACNVRSPGVLLGFVASAIAYFVISAWSGHPGWWPHLYFSSIEPQLNMNGFNPDFSVMLYLKTVLRAVVYTLWYNTWLGGVVLAVAVWFGLHRAGYRLDRRAGVLFAAILLGLAAKFVAFPIHDTRIYFPTMMPLFLLLAPVLLAFWNNASAVRMRRNFVDIPARLQMPGSNR